MAIIYILVESIILMRWLKVKLTKVICALIRKLQKLRAEKTMNYLDRDPKNVEKIGMIQDGASTSQAYLKEFFSR